MIRSALTDFQQQTPVANFDELVIRPSPQKPFETAELPARESLSPCEFCGRNFNRTTLGRHVTICERLAHKPKREAFKAVAQRLSHVAQEDAVKPVIRQILEKQSQENHHDQNFSHNPRLPKQGVAIRKKKSPVRAGRTGADLFKEQQKGHLKCAYCERTFREEAYERHVAFCKDQFLTKQRQRAKEDPKSDLLKRRVKYRPPLPRSTSKESPVLPRKAISAFSAQQATTPSPLRPTELKVLGSQSAMARMNNTPGTTAEVEKLTNRLQGATLADGTPQRYRLIAPSQDGTSPSDYGSGESLLSRAESMRHVKNGAHLPLKDKFQYDSAAAMAESHHHPQNGSFTTRVLQKTNNLMTGATRAVAPPSDLKSRNGNEMPLMRTGSIKLKNAGVTANTQLTPTASQKTTVSSLDSGYGAGEGGSLRIKNISDGVLVNSMSAQKLKQPLVSGLRAPTTPTTNQHLYPFNVASAQKEEMMQLHRSNSVRAKNSKDASAVDWDSFLKPAALRTPQTPEQDKFRFFQWNGERYTAPRQRNATKLADLSPSNAAAVNAISPTNTYGYTPFNSATGNKGVNSSATWPIHDESMEEFDTASESVSPTSPPGSAGSIKSSSVASVKSSAIGSMSSMSSIAPTTNVFLPIQNQKSSSSPAQPRYCHNCGNEFPIPNASFCCHCGMARLHTKISV